MKKDKYKSPYELKCWPVRCWRWWTNIPLVPIVAGLSTIKWLFMGAKIDDFGPNPTRWTTVKGIWFIWLSTAHHSMGNYYTTQQIIAELQETIRKQEYETQMVHRDDSIRAGHGRVHKGN